MSAPITEIVPTPGAKRPADSAEPAKKRVALVTTTWTGADGKLRTAHTSTDGLSPELVAVATVGKIKCVQFVQLDEGMLGETDEHRLYVPVAAIDDDTLAGLHEYCDTVSWAGDCGGDVFMRKIAIRLGIQEFYDDDDSQGGDEDCSPEVAAVLSKLTPDLKNACIKAEEAEREGLCILGFTCD
jgi:hypothetical protein